MNIAWDDLQSKLNLDNEQAILIKYMLKRLQDSLSDICDDQTADYNLSPPEYIADLILNNPGMDDSDIGAKLFEYLAREIRLEIPQTYMGVYSKFHTSTLREMNNVLSEEQQESLRNIRIESLLDIETGHTPLIDKIKKRVEDRKQKQDIEMFCSIPFDYAYIDENGDVYPCCPSKFKLSIGNLGRDQLKDIWNSKAAEAVRKSIIDKTFRYCDFQACEYLKEGKLTHKDNAGKNMHVKDNREIHSHNRELKIINFAYDRACNLACPSCRTQIYGSNRVDTAMIHRNILGRKLEGVQRLIISGNGDPFASSLYMDFLRNFDRKQYPDVRIKIQTNGLLFTPDRWAEIANSHDAIDWISVSIDAATEETYKLNRGGSFTKLLKNLEFISKLRKSDKIKLFFINFVVQANNFREMKQFAELGLKYGCDLIEFQCIENWGTYSPAEFKKLAVQDISHPEHEEFLKLLSDSIFTNQAVCSYKLLEFMPDEIKKNIVQRNIIRYDEFGRLSKV